MTLQKINTRSIVLMLIVLAAVAFRLISFKYPYILSNFSPVGAIAIFGGAYFYDKWKAYAVVLISMFLSDLAINYLYTSKLTFYADSLWLYLAFAIMVFIGTLIKKVNFGNVAWASMASVCVHWLIVDLPWLYGNLYPHTIGGYVQSLLAAIPFEKNMILGDALFGAILFGGFELAQRKYSVLRSNKMAAL